MQRPPAAVPLERRVERPRPACPRTAARRARPACPSYLVGDGARRRSRRARGRPGWRRCRRPARRPAWRRSRGTAARRRTTRTCRRPSARETTTTSQPLALSSGTNFLACSTRPGNSIFPSTLALSQMAMPGLVRPRMPTVRSGPRSTLIALDDVRREDRPLGDRVDRVGAEEREVELGLERPQQRDAVVELVVAERRGVVADEVHRPRHRVDHVAADRLDLGVVVRQRRALDGVAGVQDEHRAGSAPRARGR